jgi:teichuronic acid biosynthesis glycosyltransferase TuaC
VRRAPLRVLVLSRNYPSPAVPQLGIWVERMVAVAAPTMRLRVVAPVPWVPPLVPLPERFRRYRAVPRRSDGPFDVPVRHPRVPTPPGHRFQAWEAALFTPFLRPVLKRLHRDEPIDLIHAHFIFPDGVVAARIGRELGVPVVTTEHAHWDPWLPERPAVMRQVLAALPHIRFVTGVSRPVVDRIESITQGRVETRVLPNVLDNVVFHPDPLAHPERDTLLFVGAARRVKGFDVLVRALPTLLRERPELRVELVGDPFYAPYRRDLDAALALADQLGVRNAIHLKGSAPPSGVAQAMRRASVVVVPSRRESFSSVTMEAIACGTPVVASRCGGPEDIIEPGQGLLVEPDDPGALAAAIATVLRERRTFDAATLHEAMVRRFGTAASTTRLTGLYEDATSF